MLAGSVGPLGLYAQPSIGAAEKAVQASISFVRDSLNATRVHLVASSQFNGDAVLAASEDPSLTLSTPKAHVECRQGRVVELCRWTEENSDGGTVVEIKAVSQGAGPISVVQVRVVTVPAEFGRVELQGWVLRFREAEGGHLTLIDSKMTSIS